MSLEDHVGDIIRKARGMYGVTQDTAAKAAGISIIELEELEQSGICAKPIDYTRLCADLKLSPAKLEKIAKGWEPAPVDLAAWRELRQVATEQWSMSVFCYLVWDEVTREAALFDTGYDPEPVYAMIAENQLQLQHLFITHGHPDHDSGVGAIRAKFPKARLHVNDPQALPQHRLRANDFIHLGSLRITPRETPGHTEDGASYLVGNWPDDAAYVAIVGDALFSGSVGRADLTSGKAVQKVKEQILALPADTLICPGHGPLTTVAQEKAHNPFFV